MSPLQFRSGQPEKYNERENFILKIYSIYVYICFWWFAKTYTSHKYKFIGLGLVYMDMLYLFMCR